MHYQLLILFYAFLVLSVSAALFWGGAPERTGAAIVLTALAMQLVGEALQPEHLYSVDPVAVLTDAVATAGFGALSLYARRAWPIWATSLQILSLTSHFAQDVDPAVHPGIYILMKSGPTFMVLVVLLVGTIAHRLRLRRHGSETAWMAW